MNTQGSNLPQQINKPNEKPLGFFKTMLASGLGMLCAYVIINIIGFVLMIVWFISMMSFTDTKLPVAQHSFLKIDFTKPIPERSPSQLNAIMNAENSTIGMIDILTAIDQAQSDEKIDGLYLYFGTMSNQSWGQSEELRMAIERFKEYSGKPVVAYADTYTQSGYYMASVADRIYLHPAGQLDWRGIAAQPLFYKDLLEKFDVHMELIRPQSNAYKSAGETYIMNHMSEANKEQVRTYITSIWNHVVKNISLTREVSEDTLKYLADNLSCYDPRNAVRYNLIDTLAFEYDAKQLMKSQFGMKKLVDIEDYPVKNTIAGNVVAVVYAEGNVLPGEGNGVQTAVFGDDVAKALDKAADDDDVKAIVLRVNSPGGAVIASEIMTAAVERAEKKKPVVVSMSDLAASAGYEISCNATKIVALPTTLTGSIGVFATIPEVGDMLKKHLGITTDTVKTNMNAEGLSMMRPMSNVTREVMQQSIEDFYLTFIGRVAKGRHMNVDDVDKIARGRVWTGEDALRIGLVDTLGGFATAVEIACQEAGIENYRIVEYPAEKNFVNELFGVVSDEDARMQLFGRHSQIKEVDAVVDELRYWSTMERQQARLPFILNMQ